ncbi:MAG TPA: isoprenylcysteine carboxylmethyltransferase family protein [Verrucomicrobiae bacterium]|jgi:protein-S-isoprenylcysteine O-methyltransferase Ste14|nr:isoprenylcysteine carboxylmethyltransferase family protein [Verrucomicrobiae bacterium]
MSAKASRLILIFVPVAVQIGLAVLGMGGIAPFLDHPPLIALAILTFAFVIISTFTEGNLSSGEREDRGNRWVLAAFGLILVLTAWLPAYLDRRDVWCIDGDATRWLGVILFTLGCTLRLYPVFVLGRRFSGLVAIQPDHKLVTSGVYGVIRNPSYLGLLVTVIGWGLAFRSLVGVLITAVLLPPLVARINAEEALLSSQFGAEFEVYRARTSRLIPGLY